MHICWHRRRQRQLSGSALDNIYPCDKYVDTCTRGEHPLLRLRLRLLCLRSARRIVASARRAHTLHTRSLFIDKASGMCDH